MRIQYSLSKYRFQFEKYKGIDVNDTKDFEFRFFLYSKRKKE